jgi:hypothetical protein
MLKCTLKYILPWGFVGWCPTPAGYGEWIARAREAVVDLSLFIIMAGEKSIIIELMWGWKSLLYTAGG